MRNLMIALLCVLGLLSLPIPANAQQQNWTHYVRIGAYGLQAENAQAIVRDAQQSHVFGIEVDNDVTGRYESFLDPAAKLAAIQTVADAAHKLNNKAVVYIAGTECITANADKSPHSVMKDHPQWLQRRITGEPAVFTSGAAFWIRPGDEDVWISPYAMEWRKTYMDRVRQIAATRIDGIYVDIPYWMTHFDGWEDTWASFDDFTVDAFRQKTGLDARKDLKLGDFADPNFRRWIDFRIETLTDFITEIRDNARKINPNIMIIPEIYPGIEQEATRVGADVYQMYAVADAIAHEYEFGDGDHMASSRSQMDWFLYQAGMLTFRAFAQGKATWILNYSWDGDKDVDARDAMKNLAMSQVMAGANFWDAPGHSMAGSNDEATRKLIFEWIEKNEKTFYLPRSPMHPVGVYFSPKSRDYRPDEFLASYRGTLLLFLQAHREFQVVTPRTLDNFTGEVLVLPNVSTLSQAETSALRKYTEGRGKLVICGSDPVNLPASGHVIHFPTDPGKVYLAKHQNDFAAGTSQSSQDFLEATALKNNLEIDAPPTMAVNMSQVDGTPHAFLANFGGLVPRKVAVPLPVSNVYVRIPGALGNSLAFLPFLGERQILLGTKKGNQVEFILPSIERGAAIWVVAKQ
jgi:hypothetical protein